MAQLTILGFVFWQAFLYNNKNGSGAILPMMVVLGSLGGKFMLNPYVWQLYLAGPGRKTVQFFKKHLSVSPTKAYADGIYRFHQVYCPSKNISSNLRDDLKSLSEVFREETAGDDVLSAETEAKEAANTEESLDAVIRDLYEVLADEDESPEKIFDNFAGDIAYYTTLMAIEAPGVCLPYYFKYSFNVLTRIAGTFGIALPEIPAKKDYRGRFFYYAEICRAFKAFREAHHLSPYELCAFLYDFAPHYIGGTESFIIPVEKLPEPRSVYFIGGERDDAFLSKRPQTITPWQCSPDTLAGDMIVMYLKSPISAVDSLWRSVSTGFNDPFFYYYRCTYIARPKSISRFSLRAMRQDPIFSKLPIVRKNMQGINGVELKPSVYNHLLELTRAPLPPLAAPPAEADSARSITCEKDVEDQLIKPFLKRLGYSKQDYEQQLYIPIGNHNNALIPDFVICPRVQNENPTAFLLIEAKKAIASARDLEDAKRQARSYARQLNAAFTVIASQEGIWIAAADDYTRDILVHTWVELKKVDCFHTVFTLIGRKK